MRLLWARVGIPYSPATGLPIESQTVSQMVDKLPALPERTRLYLLAPVVRGRKGEYRKEIADWQKARLPAAEDRRRVLRDRGRADARQEVQARHRRRRGPHRHRGPDMERALADSLETALRAGRRHRGRRMGRHGRGRERAEADPVLRRNSPARSPASPSPRSSRGCSRSTIPSAPARSATGLGSESAFDDSTGRPQPKLTLRQGAIAPWAKSSSPYYSQTLEALAAPLQLPARQAVERTAG